MAVTVSAAAAATAGAFPAGVIGGLYVGGVCAWNAVAGRKKPIYNQPVVVPEPQQEDPLAPPVAPPPLLNFLTEEGFSNFESFTYGVTRPFKAQRGSERIKVKIMSSGAKARDTTRGEAAAQEYLWDIPEVVKRSGLIYLNSTDNGDFIILDQPAKCSIAAQAFPYIEGGSLYDFIRTAPSLKKFQKSLRCAVKLADIILRIHERRCAHRDLKSKNILYNPKTEEVFLMDNDSLIYLNEEENAHTPRGTRIYWSPRAAEAIEHSQFYSPYELDRWGFGCLIYNIFTGCSPRGPNTPNSFPRLKSYMEKAGVPKEFIGELSQLIQGLLASSPNDRLSLEQAKQILERLAKAAA